MKRDEKAFKALSAAEEEKREFDEQTLLCFLQGNWPNCRRVEMKLSVPVYDDS